MAAGGAKRYTLIATAVIPELTEVRLYDETVDKVRRGHPEVPAHLPSLVAAVTNALANPALVERIDGGNYVYIDTGTTNASGDPLRVPVKRIARSSGRVKSFYFASSERAARVVWRKVHG